MHNTIRSFNDSSTNDWTKEDKKPKMLTKQKDKYDCPRKMLENAEQEYYGRSFGDNQWDYISDVDNIDTVADREWEEYLREREIA